MIFFNLTPCRFVEWLRRLAEHADFLSSNYFLGLDTLIFWGGGGDTDVSRESAAYILRVTDFSLYLDVILSPVSRPDQKEEPRTNTNKSE